MGSAGVVVAAVFVAGSIVLSAEVKLTSVEADISNSEMAEFNSMVKASDTVVEMEPDGIVVEAAGVVTFIDLVIASFVSGTLLAEEPGLLGTEVTGMVVAVPSVLIPAIAVTPEVDGVVARLVKVAVVAMVVAVGIVVADEAAVPIAVTDVVPASKVVESAEGALVGAVVALSAGVVAASVVASLAASVVVSSPGNPEGWVVVSLRLFIIPGLVVKAGVPELEVAAPATVVSAAAVYHWWLRL